MFKIPKMKNPMFSLSPRNNLDVLYILRDIDYDRETNCEEYRCEEDECCRCEVITNIQVRNSISNKFAFYNWLWNSENKSPELEDILAFMFAKAMFNPNSFNGLARNGYYGQEIDSIMFEDSEFWRQAEIFNGLSNTERLKMILTLEYGHILPNIEEIKEWEHVQVKYENIVLGYSKQNPSVIQEYKGHLAQCNSNKTYLKNELQFYCPVVFEKNGKYPIIDGHHRFLALSQEYTLQFYKKKIEEKKRKVRGKNEYKIKKIETSYLVKEKYTPKGVWVIRPK